MRRAPGPWGSAYPRPTASLCSPARTPHQMIASYHPRHPPSSLDGPLGEGNAVQLDQETRRGKFHYPTVFNNSTGQRYGFLVAAALCWRTSSLQRPTPETTAAAGQSPLAASAPHSSTRLHRRAARGLGDPSLDDLVEAICCEGDEWRELRSHDAQRLAHALVVIQPPPQAIPRLPLPLRPIRKHKQLCKEQVQTRIIYRPG